MAAAPGGRARCVRGDDRLAQLCGCNMAIDKAALAKLGGLRSDVHRRRRRRRSFLATARTRRTLAYAPGAVVIHRAAATLAAYIRQQRGYGPAEGLLLRKYPLRASAEAGVYGGAGGWMAAWFGAGARVYYGAFGRGLFQTVYPGAILPLAAQIPLTIQWIAIALALIAGAAFDRFFAALGAIAITVSILCAGAGAALAPTGTIGGATRRAVLAILWLLGPLLRSAERERVKWIFAPDTTTAVGAAAARAGLSGSIVLTPAESFSGEAPNPERVVEALRAALVRRGLTVARGGGYDPYDLRILTPPWLRVPILALERDWQTSIGWHTRLAVWRIAIPAAALFAILTLGRVATVTALAIVVGVTLIAGAIALSRARRIPAVIAAAAAEIAGAFGLRAIGTGGES